MKQPRILKYILTRQEGQWFYHSDQWQFDLCFDRVTEYFPRVSGRLITLEVSDEPFGDEQTGVALEFELYDRCFVVLKCGDHMMHVTSGTERMLRAYFLNDDKIYVRIT